MGPDVFLIMNMIVLNVGNVKMTKRFIDGKEECIEDQFLIDSLNDKYYFISHGIEDIVNLLNELDEEKEFWKSDACKETNENNILWNEIFIMMEQGGKPSKAFEDYMVTKKRGIVNCRFA